MTIDRKRPPLPSTDWLLHMPAHQYEPEWTSSQDGFSAKDMLAYGDACAAEEREACAKLCDVVLDVNLDNHEMRIAKMTMQLVANAILARNKVQD